MTNVDSMAVEMPRALDEMYQPTDIFEPRLFAIINDSAPISAVIDTGTPYTIAPMAIANDAGIDPDAIRLPRNRVELSGFRESDASSDGYITTCRLALVYRRCLLRIRARIVFSEAQLSRGELLLGQHDLLEQLTLTHSNHKPVPNFVLEFPR